MERQCRPPATTVGPLDWVGQETDRMYQQSQTDGAKAMAVTGIVQGHAGTGGRQTDGDRNRREEEQKDSGKGDQHCQGQQSSGRVMQTVTGLIQTIIWADRQ